ncbi:MAG: cyclic nucleotide-binding domain-containing protein [Thermodesulfobacteriota bacterium]
MNPRNTLELLTDDDLRLLMQKADRHRFVKDELIVEEGSRRQALFFIRQGRVRVVRTYSGQVVAYATLGPGDVIGEMSFLENTGASASVFAEEDVELDVFEGYHVNALMTSVPGFSTRFFQSLAVTLAHRVRETSKLIPPLLVEEIPRAQHMRGPSKTPVLVGEVPEELSVEVKEFRRAILAAHALSTPDASADPYISVSKACGSLREALSRHIRQKPHLEKEIGFHVLGGTLPFFMLSDTFRIACTMPRRYFEDHHTVDRILRNQPSGEGRAGTLIDKWFLTLSLCESIRKRSRVLSDTIREARIRWSEHGVVRVMSLSSPTCREVLDASTDEIGATTHFTGLFQDGDALSFSRDLLTGSRGLVMDLFVENVLYLALGRGEVQLPQQHLIYCVGFIEHLDDDAFAVRMLNWAHSHLLPQGTLILGSFLDTNPDRHFTEHLLGWELVHRSETRLRELFAQSAFGAAPVELKGDGLGVQALASCRRLN